MKKDMALAVIVLFALAGLFAVAYAQNHEEDPNAFDLRRQLIERIEAAVSAGDTGTLDRMNAFAETTTVEPREAADALRRVADLIQNEDPNTTPEVTTQPVFDILAAARCSALLFERKQNCAQGYSSCVMYAAYPGGHRGMGLKRFNSYEERVRECEIQQLRCEIAAYEKFEKCSAWATAVPG